MAVAHEIEHHVDIADDRGEVHLRVIDQLIGAEVAQERVLLRTGRPDDVGAACLADLHREMANPAGSRVNQDALTRVKLAGRGPAIR
jgi:hypothetical protein